MKYCIEELKNMMQENGGWLDLRNTQITSLPDNLTVGGWLDLSGTQITSLPDNLTVGGSLDLRNTQITSLPDNLTVGGSLDLSGTQITHKEKERKKVKKLKNGDFVDGRYLYCDRVLIHVKRKKQIGEYTFFVGKIKRMNAIFDGENYAHCKNFKDGVCDLAFKKAQDRGADQYKEYNLDSVVSYEKARTMYRVITGACQAGTQHFIDNLGEVKEAYSIREIIELTRSQYGAEVFRRFFDKE